MIGTDLFYKPEMWLLKHHLWVNVLNFFVFMFFAGCWFILYTHKDGKLRLQLLWFFGTLTFYCLNEAIFYDPIFNHFPRILGSFPVIISSFRLLIFLARRYGIPAQRDSETVTVKGA